MHTKVIDFKRFTLILYLAKIEKLLKYQLAYI